MLKHQENTIQQVKVLFESANNGNAIDWELSKYMFRNMVSVDFGQKNGWFNGAGDDDKEYIAAFLALKNEYQDMYSDFKQDDGSIYPSYCHELALDILDQYDFSTESGKIILGMMETNFNMRSKLGKRAGEHEEEVAYAENVLDKIQEFKDKNMKPQD